MTDLEISKALALVIGWKEKQLRLTHQFGVQVSTGAPFSCYTSISWWRGFDYRDWSVIGPIAEKFECFPIRTKTDEWFANIWDQHGFYADTPQKAIALAVIAGAAK